MNSDKLQVSAESGVESALLDQLKKKILIFDGAMGTAIQSRQLAPEDFAGQEGFNEILVKTRPDVIAQIHSDYLEAGADIIETNTFGCHKAVLAEYASAEMAYELALQAAKIGQQVAAKFSQPAWPRYVSGALGPGTKLISLGQISYDELFASYLPAFEGLLAGGVDLIQIETCQDPLQLKCALAAAREAMRLQKRQVPTCVTVTVEQSGTLLVGSELLAVLSLLEALEVDIVGINCATGPDLMREHVRLLCESTRRHVAVLPNAGLPRNVGGQAVYDLAPQEFGAQLESFVRDYGVGLVGGCCGTTAAHIAELRRRLAEASPKTRQVSAQATISSTFSPVELDQSGSSPLIIDERLNANGSKQFRELLLAEDWEGLVEFAQSVSEQGAHALDVCAAYVGRDERADMEQLLKRYNRRVSLPLLVDSTQVDVLEAGLKLLAGRPIINSINLEDGEEKLGRICGLAKKFGAALIALTIDEEGMAKTVERKLAVAKRIYDLVTRQHGISAEALLFDPLTFTIASGDEESRLAASHTLQALKRIKAELPGARSLLGVSNVSFGLKPLGRQILNSVFLSEARAAGLDAAIVQAKKILPIHKIDPELLKVALDLIYDRRQPGYDPLFDFMRRVEGQSELADTAEVESVLPVEEALKRRIIDGKKSGLETLLNQALERYSALEIINSILLDGMRQVGELFGSGKMQLPFVLQSAETMKLSVSYLERFMEKGSGPQKGTIVLATVRGDVHDIGKNLVDIILSNNGYRVVNLGIKQPLENILAAAAEHGPDAVGMSGLLVKSTLVMKENLEEMKRRKIELPVICGGAALNRRYVEHDLRAAYGSGAVYYGLDAFTGLQIMDELTGQVKEKKIVGAQALAPRSSSAEKAKSCKATKAQAVPQRSTIRALDEVPQPPFWGSRVVLSESLDLSELFRFVNRKALYANQWQYRRGELGTAAYRDFIRETVDPLFAKWTALAAAEGWLEPRLVYGYFPCQSEADDLIIYAPDDHTKEVERITFPRQLSEKFLCLADYFLPKSSGRVDTLALQVVTVGARATEVGQEFFASGRYSDYLHLHGLSVECAEALAEFWHKRVRAELKIASEDGDTPEKLCKQEYRGERFSFGYPACPRLEDQTKIFALLNPERIGVELSSEFQLVPEQSTSALILHHPQAAYFSV